jgi:hypothetical protein
MRITAADLTTTQNWTINVTFAANTQTDILTFSLGSYSGTPNPSTHTVAVTVPYGTNLSNIQTNFTLSDGASADIGGTPISNGDNWDFSSPPVIMRITAADLTTTQNWTINVTFAANTQTDILTYSLAGYDGTVNIGTHNVSVTVPYGTNVTSLVATFTLSPQATATVGGINQVSGTTPNDFTNPVIYTVEAGDGTTTQDWTVTVSFAPNTETDILTYSLDGFTGTVDTTNHTVLLTVPYGTDVTDMVATFTLSDQATARVSGSVQQSGVSSLDFSSPITYNIIAGDGTTIQPWIVTVNIAPNTATDFDEYSFTQQTGPAVINTNNHTIYIQVQYGTSLNGLIASFSLSYGATTTIGGTLQISGSTANNFTNPVIYRVIAEDGSTSQDWTINVTVAPNSATDILTFSIPGEIGNSVVNSGSHSVVVVMPYNTDPTDLVASFTLSSGATARISGVLQTSGVTSNDFSNDVT